MAKQIIGPLKKVVDEYVDPTTGALKEKLECGHVIGKKSDFMGHTNAYRRRCRVCGKLAKGDCA